MGYVVLSSGFSREEDYLERFYSKQKEVVESERDKINLLERLGYGDHSHPYPSDYALLRHCERAFLDNNGFLRDD